MSTITPPSPIMRSTEHAQRSPTLLRRVGASRSDAALRRDAWLAVGIGIIIRVLQYAWDRSLFIDEAALGLNIRNRSFLELTQQLDHAQSAPLGFLFLQKTLWHVVGDNPYALRLPALIAGIAALVLFVYVARRFLPLWLVPAAVALLAVSEAAIFWGTDAKQYAFDMLAALAVLLLALRFSDEPTRRNALRLGIAGAIAPWFSIAAVIVMAGCGAVLLVRFRRSIRDLLPVAALWLLALPSVLHLRTSLSPEDRAYFAGDWWDGFLPLPFSADALALGWHALLDNLIDPLGFPYPLPAYVALAIGLAGVGWIVRGKPRDAAFLLAPFIVAVALSMAGVYPIASKWIYSGRVCLFLLPAAYVILIGGTAWAPRAAALLLSTSLFLTIAIAAIDTLPYTRGEAKRILAYAEQNVRPRDYVYVFYGIELAARYYGTEFRGTVIRGSCSSGDPEGYYRELEQFRGTSRIWVVAAYNFFGDQERVVGFMDSNATVLERRRMRVADAVLYDFSGNRSEPPPPYLSNPLAAPNPGTACRGIFTPS